MAHEERGARGSARAARWPGSALAALLVLGSAPSAHGAERGVAEAEAPPDPVREIGHDVQLRFADASVADAVVTRSFRNDARSAEEAIFTFRLPDGAAVTGFRVQTGGASLEATIRDADAALLRYEELRAPGSGTPRTAALLAWESLGLVGLRVFPVFPGERVTVQYDLTVALDYAEGRLHTAYPRHGAGEARPVLTTSAAWQDARITQDTSLVPELDPHANPLDVWVTPPAADVLAARYATLGLARDRRLTRLELEAVPRLGELPRQARVVFVIDASWSEDAEGIAAQLALVRGYLQHVPDASFEIVVFSRRAARVFGELVPAAHVDARLEAAARAGAFAPHNGSDPVAGLAVAAELLHGVKQPARVVLMSDRWFSRGYAPAAAVRALARLPRGAIVHVVERSASGSGSVSEERVTGPDFDEVVAAHGGQILGIYGDSADLAQLAAVTLGLVRPIRIDDLEVVAEGAEGAEELDREPAPLAEGEGVRDTVILPADVTAVRVRGLVWGRRFERRLRPSVGLAARLPAIAFGSERYAELLASEAALVGLAASILTPYTSFLADDPAAEASTLGFDIGYGSSSCGSHCGGTSCRGGYSRIGVAVRKGPDPDWAGKLAGWIQPAAAACARAHAVGFTARVTIEATGDEVVAVQVGGVPAAARACVEDAVWAIRLDADFAAHRDYEAAVVVPGPVVP